MGIDSAPVLPSALTGTETIWAKNASLFQIEQSPDWIDRMMFWDINLNIPPIFWDPLPYKINGMGFNEYILITGKAIAHLRKNGISQVSDEIALMAKVMRQDPQEFSEQTMSDLKQGNLDGMKRRISEINRQMASDDLI